MRSLYMCQYLHISTRVPKAKYFSTDKEVLEYRAIGTERKYLE